jgi:AcrR family transcriptional regulator
VPAGPPTPSAREVELLEAAYGYVLEHGLTDLSLRPLAAAIGSSPRVLLYLFGSKDDLVRALLARARRDELAVLDRLRTGPGSLVDAGEAVWGWLRDPAHRPLLRLWAEVYARSLVEPGGPWGGFAETTVRDWLDVVASAAPAADEVRRTALVAVLRGCLLDLLATGDEARVDAACARLLAAC